MKNLFLSFSKPVAGILLLMAVIWITGFSQVPGTINYQAVLRNGSGDILANTTVSVQLVILQGSATGSETYNETHSVTTNEFGVVSLALGSKSPATFANINWSTGTYFLKVVVNGTEMGTSQLLSVPYALYARTVGNLPLPYNDSTGSIQYAFRMVNTDESSAHSVGILGVSNGAMGTGVRGEGPKWGLWGMASGFQGRGVVGKSLDKNSIGVYGIALEENSTGMFAEGAIYDFYANGPGVDYGSSSSIRWKKNIIEIPDPIEKIKAIRGVYFDWDSNHGGMHDVGMIAEEVGKVLPEIVNFEENGIDAVGMDYSKVTPLLLEAIKAQQADIQIIKTENEQLKSDYLKLLERITAMEKNQLAEK
jgi:hypothetical protein